MKFDVEEFTVKAGSTVRIVMKNNTPLDFMGEMQHNVVIFKDESAAPMIIGLALIESLVIYALAITFLLQNKI